MSVDASARSIEFVSSLLLSIQGGVTMEVQ